MLSERYRLESLYCDALAGLMAAREALGEHEAALAVALRLLEQDPLREDAHRAAMRAYCRLGQRHAALAQYGRCQQMLQAELGVEPMAETLALRQAIVEGRLACAPGTTAAAVPVAPLRRELARHPLDAAGQMPLVGREQELAFLAEAGRRRSPGGCSLLLVSGEAGVGKTRLVQEFADQQRWQGVRVLQGRCYEFERLLPYQPMAEALRVAAAGRGGGRCAALPAGSSPRWPPGARSLRQASALPGTASAPQGCRARRRSGCSKGCPSSWPSWPARNRCCWCSRTCTGPPIRRCSCCTTWRGPSWRSPADRGHPAARGGPAGPSPGHAGPAAGAGRAGPAPALAPPVGGRGGVADRSACRARARPLRPLADRLYRETEGNPFYLIQTVKALFEQGAIRVEAGAWQADYAALGRDRLPLPASVSETIAARVGRLSEATQDAVRVAAVAGREFDFDLLKGAWGKGEEATLAALDDLLRHRLIAEAGRRRRRLRLHPPQDPGSGVRGAAPPPPAVPARAGRAGAGALARRRGRGQGRGAGLALRAGPAVGRGADGQGDHVPAAGRPAGRAAVGQPGGHRRITSAASISSTPCPRRPSACNRSSSCRSP